MQREFVDDHLFPQQGQQLHVHHQLPDVCDRVGHIGQGVVGMKHPEAFDAQIERKLQVDVLYRDRHACLL